jgi:hypothetical protein
LDSTDADADESGNLADIEGFVRAAVQQTQNAAPRLAEKNILPRIRFRSHIENDRTLSENNVNAPIPALWPKQYQGKRKGVQHGREHSEPVHLDEKRRPPPRHDRRRPNNQ